MARYKLTGYSHAAINRYTKGIPISIYQFPLVGKTTGELDDDGIAIVKIDDITVEGEFSLWWFQYEPLDNPTK